MENILQQQIKDLRDKDPNIKAINIAKELGCSRERVRQLLVRLHLPTAVDDPSDINQRCLTCGTRYRRQNHLFCSRLCYRQYNKLLLTCAVCGVTFTRKRCEYKAKLRRGQIKQVFCSLRCWGSYAGTHYGTGTHDTHKAVALVTHDKARARQAEFIKVWETSDLSIADLAAKLNISEASAYNYLHRYLKELRQ